MRKWNAALSYGLVLMFISCFSISNGLDYEDDDQKLDPFSRCPWIRNKLKNGRVRIRSRGRIAKFSCKSGYDLVGKRFATCVRGQWNGPIPMCVTKGCRKPAAPRNGKVKELNQGAALSFECNPGYSLAGGETIYCDGSQWDKEPPNCQVTTLQPAIFCDFEDPDLCGWTHDPTHDFDWKRNQFGTPSGHVGTGPSYDHTYGKGKAGFYMYGEASAPRNENDASRLFSPVYSRYYSPGCFVFWYHMYGATIGALRIYFKKESSVFAELSPSWEKHGDQGNQWLRGNVTVPTMNENFQVVIEGIRGHSYVGDTAIDDVSLIHNNCSSLDSSNSTEDVEVASQDSCRGRCHEPDNSTSCGCTDACESDNTCCSDYDKLCAEKGETSNGEDEYLQSTAKPETEATPELTVTDMVGTPLTATPAKLYTEAEANSTYSTNMTEKNTQQPTITANTPRVITVLLSTGVVTQTTNKPITTKTTEELKTKTTLIPTVPVEKVSVKTETTGVLTVTSRNPTKLTTEKPTTVSKVSTVLSTVLIATVKAPTAVTTPTTTAATTKEPPAIIQTFGSSAPPELNATDSKVSSRSFVMVPTTAAMVTSKTNLPSNPTTGIPNNTLSSEKFFTPPITTLPAALNTKTTLHVPTSETVKPTPSATKSVISFSKATTYTTVIDTQSTGRDLKVPSTLKVVPTTLTTETTLTSTTPLPVVFPKTPTTKTVRTSPPTTPLPVVTTKTTARLKPTIAMITTGLPAGFVPTLKNTRKLKTTTKHTSSLRTTESQTMKSSKEMDVPHASKAKADVPKNYSVIGVCVGLIVVAGLVGGAVYFYQRRRNAQSELRDDSEMRFLPDSEVIEYSDAAVTDNLVLS